MILSYRDGTPFAIGAAGFQDHSDDHSEIADKIWIRLQPAVSSFAFLAQLDTGAVWTLLPTELMEQLGELEDLGATSSLQTARGRFTGPLVRATFKILPSRGDEVSVDATILAARNWPGPPLLGYRGFLERVRFGLDPTRNEFLFGPG